MNYLAHAYLSFNEPQILVGNMISDFVKGRKKFNYSEGIQKGIELHRAIDEFTDHHTATQKAKLFFKKDYRLYAGAFVDIVYDHFLANDTTEFHNETILRSFSAKTYDDLQDHSSSFPWKFDLFFNHMKKEDWLYNYRHVSFIEKSFAGLVRRAAYLSESMPAVNVLEENYDRLAVCYQDFFPDLKSFSSLRFHQLIKN
jgi:acyl carrier protein phosphodiesterase